MATSEFKQTNPWTEIWVRPRKVLADRLRKDPRAWTLTLAILNGIVSGISWAVSLGTKYSQSNLYKHWFLGGFLIIFGAILGAISLYVASWLYKVIGRWLKGKGNFIDVKCALGWSCYPYLLAGIFGILNMLTVRIPLLGLLFGFISIVLLVWAFIIMLQMVGEAHGFSAWKALAILFITAVLIFIIAILIALVIPMLTPLFK